MSQSPDFGWLFDTVAPAYEAQIIPVFAPLVADMVTWANPQSSETVVDIGTGTGIVARMVAPHVRHVVGVDLAWMMVNIAQQQHDSSNLHFVQSNAHTLGMAAASCDHVMSSFGLNATDPRRVFREIHRILRPGGCLSLQEWGGIHHLDEIVMDTLEIYAVDDADADAELVALRDFLADVRPWYQHMQDTDDFVERLTAQGFINIQAQEHQAVTVSLTVNDFIAFKTAWTGRARELAAMDDATRGDCLDQMRTQLHEHTNADGRLAYNPLLFRVQAVNGWG